MNPPLEDKLKEWAREMRERQLERDKKPARRICHLWTTFPQLPDAVIPFLMRCMCCKGTVLPSSHLVFCPLYLHFQCGTCYMLNLDCKCPCFMEIERLLRKVIPQKDVAELVAFMALDY